MGEFKLLSTEEYIQTLREYSQEQIEEIQRIRTKYENMTWEQYEFLFSHGAIERKAKLKKKRTLWVNDEGEIYYLNHYKKTYQLMGIIKEG